MTLQPAGGGLIPSGMGLAMIVPSRLARETHHPGMARNCTGGIERKLLQNAQVHFTRENTTLGPIDILDACREAGIRKIELRTAEK
jgi:hypothetical protein